MKLISSEQIKAILDLVYNLRCPAPEWEGLKKLLAELPPAEQKAPPAEQEVPKAPKK